MKYTSDQLLTFMTQGKTKSRKLLLRDASVKYKESEVSVGDDEIYVASHNVLLVRNNEIPAIAKNVIIKGNCNLLEVTV